MRIRPETPADEAFMALELVPGGFGGRRGLVRYAREFDAL